MGKPKIVDQPINGIIDNLAMTFESEYRLNPFENDNLSKIFSDSTSTEAYLDILLSNVSEESERDLIAGAITRSMECRSNSIASLIRSEEGFDQTTSPGANVGALDAFAPATILGYHAKSLMLDVYKPLNHDKREFPIQFELAYAISSDSVDINDRKMLPQAIRDGSIGGMLSAQRVTLLVGGVAGAPHVTVHGGIGYAATGVKGNTLTESGKDVRDWALAEDIRIDSIVYDNSVAGDGSTTATMIVAARSEVKGYGGDTVAVRHVQVNAQLVLADNSIDEDWFSAYVNRDSGEYKSTPSATGRIKGFSFNIPILNPTNAASTVRHGRDVITARIIASPRKTMSIGLAMDTVMDEFVAVGAGNADIVKYVSNEFSAILAGVNDVDMESHMIGEIEKCISNPALLQRYIAAPRLGGYVAAETIDLTVKGIGGERPLSWLEESIKDTVSNLLILGETDTQFTEESEREWVFVGYQRNVKRFVDTKYTTESDAPQGESSRFGFKKMTTFAYSDNFGQRVKFIGTSDKRWQARPVYGFLRSNSPKVQPTGIYHGYDFRIVKSRDARQQGIDSISYWVHDTWDILALCAVKITLINPINLGQAIVKNQSIITIPAAAGVPNYQGGEPTTAWNNGGSSVTGTAN